MAPTEGIKKRKTRASSYCRCKILKSVISANDVRRIVETEYSQPKRWTASVVKLKSAHVWLAIAGLSV